VENTTSASVVGYNSRPDSDHRIKMMLFIYLFLY